MTAITCENLGFTYGRTPVLDAFDATFRPGLTLIKGFSGCGKSTLLKLVAGYLRPTAGRIVLPGGARHGAAFQRRDLGFVFQQLNLLPLASVRRNLALVGALAGLPAATTDARIDKYLALLGLEAFADREPGSLSGGQQQRAAIARALCINPRVMLFDEPTSALDPELEVEVVRVIRLLAEEGRTMILVTHDMDLARTIAHKVVFLHQGRIEEEGSPAEVFDAPKSRRLQQFLRAADHA
jgi:ABC-type polar amino acid transport system ATPase subunit